MKPHKLAEARKLFEHTGINIVGGGEEGGQRDLGIAIGSEEFIMKFLKAKVAKWLQLVDVLSQVALSQPHEVTLPLCMD